MSHILLLEPDLILSQIYAAALQQAGYVVVVCHSAQSAISSADKQAPDLVILEVELAKHNGIEFLYEFRSYTDWNHVPCIILSHAPLAMLGLDEQQIESLNVHAVHYKPTTKLTSLLKSIARVLKTEVNA